MTRPFCVAHRGLSGTEPENTLAAFEAAVSAGFPAIETDVRTTRDGEVVAIHDAGIERTTTGSGRVADMKYDELRSYPAGGGPVPRLDDLLERMEDWGGLWDLEVKAVPATIPMLGVLDHHHLGVRAHVTSMDPRVLRIAHEHRPDLPRGLIVLGPPDLEDLREARDTECAWIHVDETHLGPPVVELAEDHGLRVGAWTVNDPVRAAAFADMGVECIITDRREVLDSLQERADPDPWF